MKKERITFDQLAALSFLKFIKLDEIDMTLLMKGINDIAEVVLDDSGEYFVTVDGNVILNKSYIDRFNKNVDIKLYENLYGSRVMEYFNNIDMFEFVLKKVRFMGNGCIVKDELNNSFSSLQLRFMKLLYKKGFIVDYLHNDKLYENYKSIKLTKRGELYLYLINNEKEIEEFFRLLMLNGYNQLLLEAFLISQDLKKCSKEILTLDNFISFCEEYDKNPYVLTGDNGLKKIKISTNF